MSVLAIMAKVVALFNAIQQSPDLIAWFESLFETSGGRLKANHGDAVDFDCPKLRAAFDNSPAVHAALQEPAAQGAKAIGFADLFPIFIQYLPQIINLINSFRKPKPAA